MTAYTKQYYSIGEVSQMLDVPIYTLRFWEDQLPMFNPNRTAKGTRRFTPADIDMARYIKGLLYDKGMKIEGAAEYMAKFYRTQPPRKHRACRTAGDAIALLSEVREILDDAHAIFKTESVINYLESLPDA